MPYGFNDDKSKFELIDAVYPVGSIYMSVNSANPSTYLGGTWVAWGNGRVPVGVDASDTSLNSAEKTGGEKTHKLTTAETPAHTHTYAKPNANTGSATVAASGTAKMMNQTDKNNIATWANTLKVKTGVDAPTLSNGTSAVTGISGGAHTHTMGTTSTASGSTGSGGAHNNMQPYITCYMWKRTA